MAEPPLGMENGLAALRALIDKLRSTEDAVIVLLKNVGEVATVGTQAEGIVICTICLHHR